MFHRQSRPVISVSMLFLCEASVPAAASCHRYMAFVLHLFSFSRAFVVHLSCICLAFSIDLQRLHDGSWA